MNSFADKTRDDMIFSVFVHHAVSGTVLIERPRQALITLICEDNFFKVSKRLSVWNATGKRIAIAQKAAIMVLAKALRNNRLAAVWNRAYGNWSHVDTSEVLAWLERVVACQPRRVRRLYPEVGA